MSMTKKELVLLKEKISSEITRVLKNMEDISGDNYHLKSEDLSDEIDQATSEYERSQMLRFRNRDMFYVKKLRRALEKFETKEIGVCEDCDASIKFERLLARPTAELCISCKDEAEREEQGSFIGRQSKSLGKQVTFDATM